MNSKRTFDAKSLLEIIEDIPSDFEGDTDVDDDFDVDAVSDPTSAETIPTPDPLISAEEEQNPPDVASSSNSAEGLQEQEGEVTADSNNASCSAFQTGVVSPVVDYINNSTRRRWRKKQVTPSNGVFTSSTMNNHCFKTPVDAFQLFFN